MKKAILALLAVTATFTACKKEKEKTTQEKVMGRWKVENIVLTQVISGTSSTDTTAGSPSDYVEFRSDNKIYYSLFGAADTGSYSIISNNRMILDAADTVDITTLTDMQMSLYQREVFSGGDSETTTLNLKK